MTTCKNEAIQWVHRYALGGAAFAALPLPFSTAGLTAIEAHMMKTIGEVYEDSLGGMLSAAAKGALALGSKGLKNAARRATDSVPAPLAPVVRMLIAGATIELIGLGLILHFENKNPGKSFRMTRDTQMRDGASSA